MCGRSSAAAASGTPRARAMASSAVMSKPITPPIGASRSWPPAACTRSRTCRPSKERGAFTSFGHSRHGLRRTLRQYACAPAPGPRGKGAEPFFSCSSIQPLRDQIAGLERARRSDQMLEQRGDRLGSETSTGSPLASRDTLPVDDRQPGQRHREGDRQPASLGRRASRPGQRPCHRPPRAGFPARLPRSDQRACLGHQHGGDLQEFQAHATGHVEPGRVCPSCRVGSSVLVSHR